VSTDTALIEAVTGIAGILPDTYIRAWIKVLRAIEAPDDRTAALLIAAHPGAGLGARAALLVDAWRATEPTPAGTAVALALSAAFERHRQDLADRRVEIAVSGPLSDAVPTRLTHSVAVDVIRAATHGLLITSYAVVGVAEISREIESAADRAVRVDLILETNQHGGGMLHGPGDGRVALRALRFHPDVHLWEWAPAQRRGPGGRRGSMHAKVIAADRRVAYLGSANLTDSAYGENLEVGAVIHDQSAVGRLVDHFDRLRAEGHGPLVRLRWES
jgi:phosphatidylserine/phosphatidylglycerophosphate/cardiolipin synthase-like enzyme